MPAKKKMPALYTLKIAKKGTEQLPIILQFIDRDLCDDTYWKIKFDRKDLEILERTHAGTMIYSSVNEAIETLDIFLR